MIKPPTPLPDDAVPVGRAAGRLKVHPSTVHRWIQSGQLRAWRRNGRQYLVSQAEADALVRPVEAGRPKVKRSGARVQKAWDRWTEEGMKRHGLL